MNVRAVAHVSNIEDNLAADGVCLILFAESNDMVCAQVNLHGTR